MQIYERNLLKNLIVNTWYAIFILLIIFSIFKLIDEIPHIGPPEYTFGSLIIYLIFQLPEILNNISSLAILIGACVTISALNESNELVILNNSGVSKSFIATQTIKLSTIISLIIFSAVQIFSPTMLQIGEQYKSRMKGLPSNIIGEQNIWIKSSNKFVFIENNIDGKTLEKVSILETDSNKLSSISFAETAKVLESELKLKESCTKKFSGNDKKTINEECFPSRELKNIEITSDGLGFMKPDPKNLSLLSLIKKTILQINNDMDSKKFEIEIFSRLLIPINLIAMLYLTIPLVFKFSRSNDIQKKIFLAISVGLAFNLISKTFTIISTKITTGIFLSSVTPAIIFLFLGMILFRNNLRKND